MGRAAGAALTLSAFCLSVHAAEPAGADLKRIRERGSLRVLAVETMPEFFTCRPVANPGIDREILEGFARVMRVPLAPVEVSSWDRLIPMLLQGDGDVIAGLVTVTDERRKLIGFTSEVFPTRNVVLTRKPDDPVRSIEELARHRVGRGTSMGALIASLPIPSENVDDSLVPGRFPEAVRAGRVTACVVGLEEAILAQKKDPNLVLGMFIGPAESLAYGVRREDAELLQALDEYVKNLRRTPTWSRLVVKYLGESALEILRGARGR